MRSSIFIVLALAVAAAAQAQTLTVYDDTLQNSFQNYSYSGGSNFANTTPTHTGANSISFVGNNFNAVAFFHAAPISVATYPILRFWVHGGTAGNQPLRLYVSVTGGSSQNVPLNSYIAGGALAAGAWREATIDLRQAPFSANPQFDRIDIQYDSGAAADPAQILYIDDVTVGQPAAQTVSGMLIDHDVTVASMVSDRFTWQDSSNRPRVAVLAHNDTAPGPGGSQGGALREFRYQLANGATRTATVTTYGNAGYAGFGYVVDHSAAGNCGALDDSPLGGFIAGTWQRIFEGRHHAIFRFTQNYPRNCSTNASGSRTIPVTMDWVFSTGRDNPLYAINYDLDLASPPAAANVLRDDSRAPYGELNIDGEGFQDINGTAWGDRYKFTSTNAPGTSLTLSSPFTWNVLNSVPFVKEWIDGAITAPNNTRDATMGIVLTQTIDQQDAGGARDPSVGSDITGYWGKTSADNVHTAGASTIPDGNNWPYQANGNNLTAGTGSNNARLTWKTQFGFLGQSTYIKKNDLANPGATAPGYPKKSYSTYVILGQHSASPVEAQVTQVETVQSLTLTTVTGSVVTSGPAGITRADTVIYAPAGYNHVYGALAFAAAGNSLDANLNVGSGILKKPMIIVSNFTGSAPTVKLGGVTLVADADYFASLRPAASELWITLNRDLAGATNHLEISSVVAGVPAVPAAVVATAFSNARIDVSWTASAGAVSYQVDRKAAGGVFTQIATPAGNSFSDTTVAANASYLYRVRAVNASGASANSAADLATALIFTDPALAAGITVKAVHLAELRTSINAVRALAGLAGAVVTDAAIAGTRIKAVHVTELRTAVDEARGLLALTTGGFTDAALGGVMVKAIHFDELRSRVK